MATRAPKARWRGTLLAAGLGAWLAWAPAASAQPDGGVREEVHVERPPEGSLRRGLVAVPAWAAYAIAGAIAAIAAGVLIARAVRRRS